MKKNKMKNIENAINEINEVLKKYNCYLEISEWLSIYDKGNNKWKELDSDEVKLKIV